MGNDLAHYGVKGMKWGVRKARTGDLNARAKILERVASGTAKKREKIGVALTETSVVGLVKNGLKKEAGKKAQSLRDEERRLATGKATAGDILRAYGSVNVVSLVRAARKKTDHELK